MFDLLRKTFLGVAAAAALASGTSAATVNQSAQPLVAIANPVANAVTGTVFQNTTGSVSNLRRDVWQGSALAGTGVYTSVSGGASATYVFGSARTEFSLVWGSPDSYNKIEFYLGTTLVDTVTTASVVGPVLPCCVSGQTNIPNSLVTITGFANGGKFDTVVISSGQNAFEFANIAAIPLPAGGLLLIGALGGLALLRRRKAAA